MRTWNVPAYVSQTPSTAACGSIAMSLSRNMSPSSRRVRACDAERLALARVPVRHERVRDVDVLVVAADVRVPAGVLEGQDLDQQLVAVRVRELEVEFRRREPEELRVQAVILEVRRERALDLELAQADAGRGERAEPGPGPGLVVQLDLHGQSVAKDGAAAYLEQRDVVHGVEGRDVRGRRERTGGARSRDRAALAHERDGPRHVLPR